MSGVHARTIVGLVREGDAARRPDVGGKDCVEHGGGGRIRAVCRFSESVMQQSQTFSLIPSPSERRTQYRRWRGCWKYIGLEIASLLASLAIVYLLIEKPVLGVPQSNYPV